VARLRFPVTLLAEAASRVRQRYGREVIVAEVTR
jgi:hypothetical protein